MNTFSADQLDPCIAGLYYGFLDVELVKTAL